MTEPHDLSPADLEAVSAHLDGEATADEVARIGADPALQALAARLGAARDRLAVEDPPASVVESQISAALDAFDTGPATAPVVDLAAERARRWYHRVPLGAVAAAVLAVAVVGAITQIDTGGDDAAETATATDSAEDSAREETTLADDAGGSRGAGEYDAGDGPASAAAAPEAAMLEFATVDELAAHISGEVLAPRSTRSQLDEGGDDTDAAPDHESSGLEQVEGCDPVAAAGIEGAPLLALVPALVDGRTVTAVVVESEGGPRLVVVDDATCAVTDDRILDR